MGSTNSRPPSRSVQVTTRLPGDEKLGFEGAVAALGKLNEKKKIILYVYLSMISLKAFIEEKGKDTGL